MRRGHAGGLKAVGDSDPGRIIGSACGKPTTVSDHNTTQFSIANRAHLGSMTSRARRKRGVYNGREGHLPCSFDRIDSWKRNRIRTVYNCGSEFAFSAHMGIRSGGWSRGPY